MESELNAIERAMFLRGVVAGYTAALSDWDAGTKVHQSEEKILAAWMGTLLECAGLSDSPDVLPHHVVRQLIGQMVRVEAKRGPLDSDMAALGVITEEYHEVIDAMRRGEPWKVRAELMDLAIGVLRRVVAMDRVTGAGPG